MQKSNKCGYKMGEFTREKKKYLRPEEAIESTKKLNSDPSKLNLFVAYKCTTCYCFHVGKSHKTNPNYGK